MRTLVKRKQPIRRNFPSIFDDLFFGEEFRPLSQQSSFPSVNIKEEETAFTLEFAIPGYNKEDLSIRVEDDILSISSEKESQSNSNEEAYTRKEFSYTSFNRSFSLPEIVDVDKIEAKTQDGMLYLTLPKKDELLQNKTKTIAIN
jgi:HSP20 family protein